LRDASGYSLRWWLRSAPFLSSSIRPRSHDPNVAAPGAEPPPDWTRGRTTELVRARSWVWNRDLWIAWPRGAHAHAAAYLIGLRTVTCAQQFGDVT